MDAAGVSRASGPDYGAVPLPITIALPAGDYRITLGAQGRASFSIAVRIDAGKTAVVPAAELPSNALFKQQAPDIDLADQLDIADLFAVRETGK